MNKSISWKRNIIPEYLARNLVFPGASLLQRPVEANSSGTWALVDATTAIPAFIGMKDDRRFTFYRIGYKYVYLADFDTLITSIAYLRVEYDRCVRSSDVR